MTQWWSSHHYNNYDHYDDDCSSSCYLSLSGNYSCTCPVGYHGSRCENNTNECQSNPCFHGGTCHDRLNHYFCQCPVGFLGNRCEANVIECLSNPCVNNGTCVENIGKAGYTCQCTNGFGGNYFPFVKSKTIRMHRNHG